MPSLSPHGGIAGMMATWAGQGIKPPVHGGEGNNTRDGETEQTTGFGDIDARCEAANQGSGSG